MDDVYAVGFYTPAPLYALGYTMAKAIAAADGDKALGRLIGDPGDAFVRRYIALTETTGGKDLPKLGPAARRWSSRQQCRTSRLLQK